MSAAQMIDRVAAKLERKLYEVPVGFKWFVDGLLDGSLGFCGEESAGASFAGLMGEYGQLIKMVLFPLCFPLKLLPQWEKIRAKFIMSLAKEFGVSFYDRIEAAATPDKRNS